MKYRPPKYNDLYEKQHQENIHCREGLYFRCMMRVRCERRGEAVNKEVSQLKALHSSCTSNSLSRQCFFVLSLSLLRFWSSFPWRQWIRFPGNNARTLSSFLLSDSPSQPKQCTTASDSFIPLLPWCEYMPYMPYCCRSENIMHY